MNTSLNQHTFEGAIFFPVSQEKAWTVFTSGMGGWWPKSHSVSKSAQQTVVIEPKNGGRWFEIGADGSESDWGGVLSWDPFSRLVLAWRLNSQWAYDPNFETEVEVLFVPEGTGTRVTLRHHNLDRFGEAAASIKEQFEGDGGWNGLLKLFAESANA